MIRIVIVDDEPLARRRLLRMLRAENDVKIVGEAGDGVAAISTIRAQSPDAVLLDIQMPQSDGFAVVEALWGRRDRGTGSRRQVPAIIFITAYDEYAVRAFEVQALDYLLKPFTRERLRGAMARLRQQLTEPAAERERQLAALLEDARRHQRLAPRLAVKTGSRTLLLDPASVERIEAEGNYARLWQGKTSYLVRRTLASLEAELDRTRFLRVHRSAIVNVECIKEVQPWFHGDAILVLASGARVTLSRTFRENARKTLGGDW